MNMSVENGPKSKDKGDPPNVPPRKRTLSQHHHTKQTSNTYQPVVPKLQSLATVDLGKHQELRAFPPTLKPKPAGYRIYDALDENEAQFPLPLPPRKGLEQAPPLPIQPIPRHSPRQKHFISGSSLTHQPPISPLPPENPSVVPDDEETLTLADFVKKYNQSLPVKVQVDEGYCGIEEQFVISTGDIYNFHFIKNEKVMSIEDAGGAHFSTPINSDIQFGLLYNPVGDTVQAVKGYSFKTVGELAKYDIPPRVIRATRSYNVSDPKSSIEAEEILIVKKIGRTAIKRKHYIRVLSLRSREEKTLYEDCEGNFLTDPNSVRLYLTELVECFGECLPLKAMLFLNSDVTDDSVSHLISEVITLTHVSIVTSIIATTCFNEDGADEHLSKLNDENDIPVAIPIELEISIHILKAQSDQEDLHHCTKELFDNFDPTKIRNISGPNSSRNTGCTFRQPTRAGYEHRGLEILKPTRIYDVCENGQNSGGTTLRHAQQGPKSDQIVTHQQLVNVLQRKPFEKQASTAQTTSLQLWTSSTSLGLSVQASPMIVEVNKSLTFTDNIVDSNTTSTNPQMCGGFSMDGSLSDNKMSIEKQLLDLKSELKQVISMVDVLTSKYEAVNNEVTQLKELMKVNEPLNTSSTTVRQSSSTSFTQNIQELKNLDCEQILKLLRIMNLEVYLQVFMNEQIDGEILAQCDDNVLQHELNVTSFIHRARLMKVIRGKYSVIKILAGLSPYGTVGD